MSETKWTQEQWEAITEKDCNLLVAAAAGAGKTAVLVERIIKKITDEKEPVDIDRLLIVTFTNAAATEMRERIADAISKVLEKDAHSKLIQRQLALLGKASITTIHAFCMEVIRNNFQSLNIDPNFRIADETESMLMKLEALNEVFEEQYEKENNEDFFALLECYGGNRDDQILMDMVLNLYDFIQSSPWPQAWLEEMTDSFRVPEDKDFGQTPWGRVLINTVKLELEGLYDQMQRAVERLKTAIGLEKYIPVYKDELEQIKTLIALAHGASWDSLYEGLGDITFATLPRTAKEVDKDRQEEVKKIRDEVKARIKKLQEKVVSSDSKSINGDLNALYPLIKSLAKLVTDFSQKYAEKKSRKSVTDFNDLEHFCLALLSEKGLDGGLKPSPIALGYREKFKEILVDEYQDSNMVQEIMIRMISRADSETPNVFMVGDVKQSIYRFRQARPELFLEKYRTYSPEKGRPFRKILLFKNFRSRKNVVDAVNFIFKQIMSVNAGELDYTDEEALNPGAAFEEPIDDSLIVGGEAELHLIRTGDAKKAQMPEYESAQEASNEHEEAEDEEVLDNIQCEARLVAQRILELMRPDTDGKYYGVWDKSLKTYRRAEFRDIVILLRTTRNWAEVFAEELALMGIPAFADTGSGFFKTIEVQVILSLLQVIDNPLQDIPLLSVLRSPIVGFTTDELAQLRLIERKGPLYHALVKLADEDGKEISRKAAKFVDKLRDWRETARYTSTDELIWKLYNDTGYYAMVGAMPAGEQRQANLRMLFNRARQFEETSYKGLFNFISFVDKLKSSRGDMGSAKILSESDNVVRIMSIHKSKGLEFPIVFISGCGKKFNLQDMNKSILLHQDLGFGPEVVDHRLRISWPSAAKQAIREKVRTETLSEEMRILYVALTRAREKLIITGGVADPDKSLAKWMASAAVREAKLPDYEMLKGNNYLDWIMPALLRHKACDALRSWAPVGTTFEGGLMEDPSQWHTALWNKSDVMGRKAEEEGETGNFIAWLDCLGKPSENISEDDALTRSVLQKEIHHRLSWQYAYNGATQIPAKVSVTELKRQLSIQNTEDSGFLSSERRIEPFSVPLVKKPKFLEEKKGLSAAEKGTIMHFVLQHLDLEALRGLRDSSKDELVGELTRQTEGMVLKDLITRQQMECVDMNRLSGFFTSPLGSRMLSAQTIHREVPFNMEIPCAELYGQAACQEEANDAVLLQGVIDCFFEEPGGIVLLDYKTDYVPDGGTEVIKERYRLQMNYYARALKLLTGKEMLGRFIYLFHNGEIVDMEN